jgi:hypothetical protein
MLFQETAKCFRYFIEKKILGLHSDMIQSTNQESSEILMPIA